MAHLDGDKSMTKHTLAAAKAHPEAAQAEPSPSPDSTQVPTEQIEAVLKSQPWTPEHCKNYPHWASEEIALLRAAVLALQSAPVGVAQPVALTADEHAVLRAAVRDSAELVAHGRLAQPVGSELTDEPLWAVIRELRDEAAEALAHDPAVGIFANQELADSLKDWADRLEATPSAFYEDVYVQCGAEIEPLVLAGKLPGSVVESVQMMVAALSTPPAERAQGEPVAQPCIYADLCNIEGTCTNGCQNRAAHPQGANEPAEDAARYRWIKADEGEQFRVIQLSVGAHLWDDTIDFAIKAEAERKSAGGQS